MYQFLSFVDLDINKNIGVCIVQANSMEEGIHKAWILKINPGGEVMGFSLSEEGFEKESLELNRLYTSDEAESLGYKKIKDFEGTI